MVFSVSKLVWAIWVTKLASPPTCDILPNASPAAQRNIGSELASAPWRERERRESKEKEVEKREEEREEGRRTKEEDIKGRGTYCNESIGTGKEFLLPEYSLYLHKILWPTHNAYAHTGKNAV